MTPLNLADLRQLASLGWNRISGRFLPRRLERAGAIVIAGMACRMAHQRRRLTEARLKEAFGEMSAARIQNLTKEIFRHGWIENTMIARLRRSDPNARIRFEGLERLDEALACGMGVILWESSFGGRLISKVGLVRRGYAISQVHADEHWSSNTFLGSRLLRHMHRSVESSFSLETIDIQYDSLAYLKEIVLKLKQNEIVCISATGQYGRRFVPVKFLGASACFATGALSLARLTGASIIPVFCVRDGNDSHTVVLEEPISVNPSLQGDEGITGAVKNYAALLESYIVRHPEQWDDWQLFPSTPCKEHAGFVERTNRQDPG